MALREGIAEGFVGEDRRADREIGEAERALLAERERGLERAAGLREAVRELLQPPRRGEADRHTIRCVRSVRGDPGDAVIEREMQAFGLEAPTRAEREVLAFGVDAEGRALAPQLLGVQRPGQQCEHEPVAALLLLARLLELDLAVGGADHVHHGVGPAPQGLAEGQHGGHVGALLPRQLAEPRPDGGDRDPVGVKDRVDGHALLGPLATDRGGALESLVRAVFQIFLIACSFCQQPFAAKPFRNFVGSAALQFT